MKAGKLLLAIAVLAMAAGVGQAQTNRTRDIQRSAMRAMKNREQARKDSIEKAKAQAVIDSLNEVEAKREKQMKADDATIRQAVRRGLKRARTRGTTEEAETADIDVSGKTGETQENQVSKSSSQFTDQKTVEETGKSANTSTGNEGAYGRATRPGTSSSSNTQQNTGQRPPTGTSQKQENTGSRPSSGTGSRSGAPESSSNTGSRPSTSTGSRSGNDNSKSEGETRERGGIKGRGDDSTSSSGETRKRERGERAEGSNRKHMVKKEDTPVDRTKIFNEGFAAIADIDKMTALTVPAPQNANLPSVIQSNGKAFVLTKETHDARSSTDEIFATNYENIYPGAIIWADGALANGDPTLVGLPAGKVTLRVDFNTGGGSSKVSNVTNTADEVQDAIYRLVQNANYRPSPSLNYKSFYSSSAEEMAVSMKANLGFLNNKANINTKYSKSETHVYKVEDYTQKYYTVSITQEADKSKYFGESVDSWMYVSDKLYERDSHNQVPMAIITSVAYGRRAYKIYDYSSSSFKFSGSESVKLYGQSLGSTQDIAENSETRNVWMYMDGGDVESSGSILQGNDINTAISTKLAYNPSTNQGVPIWYTVRFLATGNTVTIKTTGEYTSYSYQELPTAISVTLRNNCTHVAGAGLKMRLDYRIFKFDANGNKIVMPAENTHVENGYTRYVEGNYDFGEERTFLLRLYEGEFLDGPIRFQVRCKTTSSGKWHNDIVDLILPDQKGVIDINIHGAIRPDGTDAYVHSSSYTKLNSHRE